MNEILFEILKAVVVLAVILFVRYAVPFIKVKIEASKYDWIIQWAEIAVRSAEQTILGSGTGKDKKAIVTEFLKKLLISKNISLSDEQLDNLIEAAVFAMNEGKQVKA